MPSEEAAESLLVMEPLAETLNRFKHRGHAYWVAMTNYCVGDGDVTEGDWFDRFEAEAICWRYEREAAEKEGS